MLSESIEYFLRSGRQCFMPLLIILLAPLGSPSAAPGGDRVYQLGVFPYLPPAQLETAFAPVAEQFSAVLGVPVKFRSRPDFTTFRSNVTQQVYDIVYIQPFGYIRAAAPAGYIPLARFVSLNDTGDTGLLKAIVVVAEESDIDDIHDLRGAVIAMPDREAAVSLLGLSFLRQVGLFDGDTVRILYQLNHGSCMQQVIIRKASACVTAYPAKAQFEYKTGRRLKVIAKTRRIPSTLFAVHNRVPAPLRERLRAEITSWTRLNQGKHILDSLHMRRYLETSDSDYDPVRRIWNELRGN